MSDKDKQRLLGASLLVAVIVIIWLLLQSSPATAAGATGNSPEGVTVPPIDLQPANYTVGGLTATLI